MSKTNSIKNRPRVPDWQRDRRQQTSRALELQRENLAYMREEIARQRASEDRALARIDQIHAELQCWVDGGEFPAIADVFARLWAPLERDIEGPAYRPVNDKDGEAHRARLRVLMGEIYALISLDGFDWDGIEELPERIETATRHPLRVACGFVEAREVQEASEASGRAA